VQRGDSSRQFDVARLSKESSLDLARDRILAGLSGERGARGKGGLAFNVHPGLDDLPKEHATSIEINGHPVATLLCTPSELAELGAGWVFGQGYAEHPNEIRSVNPRSNRISVMIDAPGPGGSAWRVLMTAGFDAEHLRVPELANVGLMPLAGRGAPGAWTMPRDVFLLSVTDIFTTFRDEGRAGGFHHAGVTDGRQTSPFMRDVSRHNAVDKVVGWALLRRVERQSQILCLSGRISADIVLKAWRAGFPAIASRSLPTAEAVELATLAGIMLVGRILDSRRSVFTHGWRLSLDDKRA
jgi:FdhD protein